MSITIPARPLHAEADADRPPNMTGLVVGLLFALPIWAAIFAVMF